MKRLLFSLIPLMLLPACGDDDPVIPPPSGPKFENLSERWHVLHNLELAYNQRNITQLDNILDTDFTFFLSDGDIALGIPGNQWDRADEILQSGRLFSRAEIPPYPLCRSIAVNVLFDGEIEWDDIVGPGEAWYEATVFYDFTIQIEPDFTYLASPGSKAQFTVRNDGTDEHPKWQLVEWQDLGSASAMTRRMTESTEESTWGRAKALYR